MSLTEFTVSPRYDQLIGDGIIRHVGDVIRAMTPGEAAHQLSVPVDPLYSVVPLICHIQTALAVDTGAAGQVKLQIIVT